MTIGEKLQQRRKELSLTQDMVAQKLHVSRQAVSNWELGKNYPDLETIILVSDVYQLSLDSLLKGDKLAVKEMKRTINRNLIKKGGLALSGIASLICLIIDFAITGRFTWSLIVITSICSLLIIFLAYELSQNHKVINSLVTCSLLVLPYLFILERSLILSQYTDKTWFMAIGLPISLLWLGFVWLAIGCQLLFKWHWAYSFAVLAFLSVIGNQLTHLLLGTHQGWLTIFISSGLGSVLGGILSLLLGYYLTKQQTK